MQRLTPAALIVIALPVVAAAAEHRPDFTAQVIDAAMAGDCKAVGDIDGDGLADLVVGGMPDEKLVWYQAPHWRKRVIATPSREFTTDCAMGDVDGDGRLDIVVPDEPGQGILLWFRNPPAATRGAAWKAHTIGSIGGTGKDVELADFDRDGRLDVATRSRNRAMIFFQGPGGWSPVALPVRSLGDEGMASGDIDGDGRVDLVVQGAWLRNPGGPAARTPSGWSEHIIGRAPGPFKAVVADMDGDGRADVVFSSSEQQADIVWWSPGADGPTGRWDPHVVVADVDRAHTLQAADMDGDGAMDLVAGQMAAAPDKTIAVYLNPDRRGRSWRRVVAGTTGLHNGVVADIDGDGAPDIFGANHTGIPPVTVWRNRIHSQGSSPVVLHQQDVAR